MKRSTVSFSITTGFVTTPTQIITDNNNSTDIITATSRRNGITDYGNSRRPLLILILNLNDILTEIISFESYTIDTV